MLVRVYLVGWMKAVAGALRGDRRPLELRDTVPDNPVPSTDDEAEDRDTWPEAGLADLMGHHPLAEMRIELAGSAAELDVRTHHLMNVIEREVRNLTADWDCQVQVTPHDKG